MKKVRKRGMRKAALPGSYTVEAAGVMAAVLLVLMILMNQAFRMRAETVGAFQLHETVERERHEAGQVDEDTITCQDDGPGWSLEVTMSVFRPEQSLRLWSLAEEQP